MRFGIALIVAGIAVIIFTLTFGFPKAPPEPMAIEYADYSDPIVFSGGEIQNNVPPAANEETVICGTTASGTVTFSSPIMARTGQGEIATEVSSITCIGGVE